jgi:hypothetical protein
MVNSSTAEPPEDVVLGYPVLGVGGQEHDLLVGPVQLGLGLAVVILRRLEVPLSSRVGIEELLLALELALGCRQIRLSLKVVREGLADVGRGHDHKGTPAVHPLSQLG